MSVHICWTEPLYEVSRRSIGEKHCFVCRKRRAFDLVVDAPVEISYYGPNTRIECTICKKANADCFPGTWREWE